MDVTSYYIPETASDAVSDLYADADAETTETLEASVNYLPFMETIVNQLVVTDLFLGLILGCMCASIFSRYIRG